MSGVKDTFDILTDEITLIRREIEQLQRSSLNKDEAKALNEQLVQGVASMAQTGQAVYEAISERMDLRLEKLAMETILAATDAARKAIEKSHAETSSTTESGQAARAQDRQERRGVRHRRYRVAAEGSAFEVQEIRQGRCRRRTRKGVLDRRKRRQMAVQAHWPQGR